MPPWASQFLGIYESRILIQVRSSLQSPGLRLRESPTYRGKRPIAASCGTPSRSKARGKGPWRRTGSGQSVREQKQAFGAQRRKPKALLCSVISRVGGICSSPSDLHLKQMQTLKARCFGALYDFIPQALWSTHCAPGSAPGAGGWGWGRGIRRACSCSHNTRRGRPGAGIEGATAGRGQRPADRHPPGGLSPKPCTQCRGLDSHRMHQQTAPCQKAYQKPDACGLEK